MVSGYIHTCTDATQGKATARADASLRVASLGATPREGPMHAAIDGMMIRGLGPRPAGLGRVTLQRAHRFRGTVQGSRPSLVWWREQSTRQRASCGVIILRGQ